MIQPQSYLNVADNSGAKRLMCIRVLGRNQNQFANIGDIIIAVVKEALPNMSIKRSDIVRAVIVRSCKGINRTNGMAIRFDDNEACDSCSVSMLLAEGTEEAARNECVDAY